MQFTKLEINLQLFYRELALWPWARDWQFDRKTALAAATKKIYFNSPELWALKNLSNKFDSINFKNFLKFSNHFFPDLIRNCHYQPVPHPLPTLDPWYRHTAGPTLPFFGPCLHPHLAFSTTCSSPQSFTHQVDRRGIFRSLSCFLTMPGIRIEKSLRSALRRASLSLGLEIRACTPKASLFFKYD